MTLFFTKHNARHPDLFQNLRKYSFLPFFSYCRNTRQTRLCRRFHSPRYTAKIYYSHRIFSAEPMVNRGVMSRGEHDMTLDRDFQRPVALVIAGTTHMVRSIREAAWLLADQWPDFSCEYFRKALSACAAALEGRRSATYARRALILAAHRANVAIAPEQTQAA
ncbi:MULTISPECIES: DUF982 domain-containing protein [Rhizobium/Agrobacterium group]|uniref:DUF982 domain-containing protein n=1 Tax=Rhizobium/Agrobacterium group TaxID=227290 RepID=UPI000AA136F1|nr:MULTISPECIES: DUF982 domain-containing protein [Rhizobium/Agrobacterium group]